MKKFISLMMAMAMTSALAIPAFAGANNPPPGQSTVEVTGAISVPTIDIEAPSEATLVLNPYRMVYNGDIKSLQGSQDQILALAGVYVNKTDVDLKVEVTATANPASSITLSADAPAAAETDKKVQLKFKFGELADKDGSAFVDTNTSNLAETAFPQETKKIEMKKGESTDTRLKMAATDGKTANYFGFKFSGAATPDPNTAWDENDKIGVSVVVKATPVALTVANNNGGGNGGNG